MLSCPLCSPPSSGNTTGASAARRLHAPGRRLHAALGLFGDRGYAATPMTAIAERAGVALDTVYASVGRKPELARLLIETAISGSSQAVPAGERGYVQAIRAAPDAETKIAIYASHADDHRPSRSRPGYRPAGRTGRAGTSGAVARDR